MTRLLTRNEQFMLTAMTTAGLSHADRGKVGIVAVKDNRILAQGYNGRPTGLNNKCEFDDIDKTRPEVLHAEENLAAWAGREGIALKGSTAYITRTPCLNCAAILVQLGITKLYYLFEHPHGNGLPLLDEAGIPHEKLYIPEDLLTNYKERLEPYL